MLISALQRAIGLIRVTENRGRISITGIPTDVFMRDVQAIWKTSKIANNITTNFSRGRIDFDSFYALEIYYIFKRLQREQNVWMTSRVIKTVLQHLESETWLRSTVSHEVIEFDSRPLRVFKKTPLPHQAEFFNVYLKYTKMMELNGYMLAAAAGGGKTLTSLMLAEILGVDNVIIVCPKNAVMDVWVKTLQTEYKTGIPVHWHSLMSGLPTVHHRFIVAHYEALPKLMGLMSDLSNKKVMITLDESHNMNDIKSARTNGFVEFCEGSGAENIIWASGTPLKAMGKEAIPFIKTIDPKFTPQVEASFKRVFGMSTDHALDILAHRLGMSMHKVEKTNVMDSEPIEEDLKVTWSGAARYTLKSISDEMAAFITERKAYYKNREDEDIRFYRECVGYAEDRMSTVERETLKEYRQKALTLHRASDHRMLGEEMIFCNAYEKKHIEPKLPPDWIKRFRDVKSVYKYTILKIRGEALGRILGKRRAECHAEMVEHFDFSSIIDHAEKKTLIFTSFVEAVKAAEIKLRKDGHHPMLVYGDTNANLPSIINRFSNDPKIDPLVATYQSLSTAVPITAANVVILLNQPFRVHERVQAISRAHRIGQDTQVRVFSVLLDTGDEPNISTRSQDIMEWSKRQVDLMMGTHSVPEVSMEAEDYFNHYLEAYEIALEQEYPRVDTPNHLQW